MISQGSGLEKIDLPEAFFSQVVYVSVLPASHPAGPCPRPTGQCPRGPAPTLRSTAAQPSGAVGWCTSPPGPFRDPWVPCPSGPLGFPRGWHALKGRRGNRRGVGVVFMVMGWMRGNLHPNPDPHLSPNHKLDSRSTIAYIPSTQEPRPPPHQRGPVPRRRSADGAPRPPRCHGQGLPTPGSLPPHRLPEYCPPLIKLTLVRAGSPRLCARFYFPLAVAPRPALHQYHLFHSVCFRHRGSPPRTTGAVDQWAAGDYYAAGGAPVPVTRTPGIARQGGD